MTQRPQREPSRTRSLRVISWNVNGLRAAAGKGFLSWLRGSRAQIVGLQEVRALPEQLPPDVRAPRGWHAAFSAAERKGYSGVGLYSRMPADAIESALGIPRFDREGRVQLGRFGQLLVVNAYFPKGSGTLRDNSRVPYKLAFYARSSGGCSRRWAHGERVLVLGDFNTAHREIDLAQAQGNREDQWLSARRARRARSLAARRLGRQLPPLRARGPATTPGGANAWARASATSAGASTTCSPPRAPCPSCNARASTRKSVAPTTVRSASTSTRACSIARAQVPADTPLARAVHEP